MLERHLPSLSKLFIENYMTKLLAWGKNNKKGMHKKCRTRTIEVCLAII